MKTMTLLKLSILVGVLGIIIFMNFIVLNALQDEWQKVIGLSFLIIMIVFLTDMNYKNLKRLKSRNK